MTLDDRTRDRIRWHCRRGLLELDLMLNAFLERHFDRLEPQEVDVFAHVLEYPDPVLFDFVMGHAEPENALERKLVALMRSIPLRDAQTVR